MIDQEETQGDTKYEHWMRELELERDAHKKFRKTGKAVVERYIDEKERTTSKFNILWSNTEVMHAAIYAQEPKPEIMRRYRDDDPIAREASLLMERAVSYAMDQFDFDACADYVIDDYLIPGVGTARVRYRPYIVKGEAPRIDLEEQREITGFDEVLQEDTYESRYYDGESPVSADKVEVDEAGPFTYGEPDEEVVYEEVTMEPVPWTRFRWQPAEKWTDVGWIGIESYLRKHELREQFPEHADHIQLRYTEQGGKSEDHTKLSTALIIEIFDKNERKVCVLAPGYDKILKEEDDPLGLEDFYPIVPPLFATVTSDKLVPRPDYTFYQDQAEELDNVTNRIDKLTEQLKYRGVYDGSFSKLADVASSDDGDFQPVDNFMERFGNSASLDAAIKHMPIEEIARVLVVLYKSREEIKQTIYEITGIADIMRGSSAASETLGAQQLKTQFGSMRLSKRQRKVASFMRASVKLMAEVIVEQFEPETLELMTGVTVTPEMIDIMKNDLMRSYKIDIETDSTISNDQAQERQDRIELLTAITGFMTGVMPLVQAGMPMDVAKELLMFGVRSFKDGRQIEAALNRIGQAPGQQVEQGEPALPGEQLPPEVAGTQPGAVPQQGPMGLVG